MIQSLSIIVLPSPTSAAIITKYQQRIKSTAKQQYWKESETTQPCLCHIYRPLPPQLLIVATTEHTIRPPKVGYTIICYKHRLLKKRDRYLIFTNNLGLPSLVPITKIIPCLYHLTLDLPHIQTRLRSLYTNMCGREPLHTWTK